MKRFRPRRYGKKWRDRVDEVIGKVLKGEFWLPEEPTKKWLGTLKFKAGYHGELDLQQIEGSLTDPGVQLPMLHGSLTNHYGYAVTLYNVIIVGKQRYLDRPTTICSRA